MDWKVLLALNLLYMLLVLQYSDTLSNTEVVVTKIPIVEDTTTEWTSLCEHLVQMMMDSNDADKGKIDVIFFQMAIKLQDLKYDGFIRILSKYGNERITFRSFLASSLVRDIQAHFVFLIIDDMTVNANDLIERYFQIIFEDQTTKFFVILRDSHMLQSIWASMLGTRYYNAYFIILMNNKEYRMSRNVIEKVEKHSTLELRETRVTKYQTIKDTLQYGMIDGYNVVLYNSFPRSYVKNGSIVGPAGNLVRELSKKVRASYRILNNPNSSPLLSEVYKLMAYRADINLFPLFSFQSNKFESTWINEIDGLCMLVPRNIPVSSLENFTLPLDQPSLILAFISTILVVICWKVISIVTNTQRSISSILFAVYELTLNFGASGLEELGIHENFLIYSYIFGSFILVSFYESIFLSLMLTEATFRSADSIQELINRKTKFYTYVDLETITTEYVPIIPDELIINKVDLLSPLELEVPNQFDKDLVYLVSCQYAHIFVNSKRNVLNSGRIFDKMSLGEQFQYYTCRKGFFFVDEFVNLVMDLQESGIYRFWYKQAYEEALTHLKSFVYSEVSAFDMIAFSGMAIPLIVLLIGCVVSFAVFMAESIAYKWKELCLNRVRVARNQIQVSKIKRNIKLDKWKQKYVYKKSLKDDGIIESRVDKLPQVMDRMLAVDVRKETIKGRESISGTLFAIKKFKKPIKGRYRHRIIQVRPYNLETSL